MVVIDDKPKEASTSEHISADREPQPSSSSATTPPTFDATVAASNASTQPLNNLPPIIVIKHGSRYAVGISQLLVASITLSIVSFSFSMISFGFNSLFVIPSAFIITFTQNVVVLVQSSRFRGWLRRNSNTLSPTALASSIPPASKKWVIWTTFFAALVWQTGTVLLLTNTIFASMGNRFELKLWASSASLYTYHMQWVTALVEVALLLTIAILSFKDRRKILGISGKERWYKLGEEVVLEKEPRPLDPDLPAYTP